MTLVPMENEEWINELVDAVVSEVQRTGYFTRVNTHEPKRKPGRGLTAAVWCQRIDPIGSVSGVDNTSGRVTLIIRIFSNMLKEPQDAIDPECMRAVSAIMRRLHDDFDFDGLIRNV